MRNKIMISKEEARSFLINYHNLNDTRNYEGMDGIMQCFQQIKSIQYDPLNVVGRNADLVLQARVKGYKSKMLHDLLYQRNELIDGFDKEMCIYETNEFHYFEKIRKACGESTKKTLAYRGQLDALQILEQVKEHVMQHGMTSSRDISIGESRESKWGHKKLSSAALDYLYCIGELSVKEKRGVHKYYDFTENVVPKKILEKEDFKREEEFIEWYIKRRIQSVGLLWNKRGGAWQGHFIAEKNLREKVLNHLYQKDELLMVNIEGIDSPFYMSPEAEQFLYSNSNKRHVKFLAPLDNILWDREMVKKIFDFEYRWEVYTPIVKRKYGYYVLPVLYGNQLIARFEPEKCRKDAPLIIKNWWWEPNITVTDKMLEQIHRSIRSFAEYLSVSSLDSYKNVIMNQKEEL